MHSSLQGSAMQNVENSTGVRPENIYLSHRRVFALRILTLIIISRRVFAQSTCNIMCKIVCRVFALQIHIILCGIIRRAFALRMNSVIYEQKYERRPEHIFTSMWGSTSSLACTQSEHEN